MMAVVMMAVTVVAMMMVPVPGTALFFPGAAVLVRTAFVQGEFIAHADIEFAHSVFPKVAAFDDRRKNIIIKSSKIKYSHQKIIMQV
jgi:hypothetical protein